MAGERAGRLRLRCLAERARDVRSRASSAQRLQPPLILVLVDLPGGEPLGQDPLGVGPVGPAFTRPPVTGPSEHRHDPPDDQPPEGDHRQAHQGPAPPAPAIPSPHHRGFLLHCRPAGPPVTSRPTSGILAICPTSATVRADHGSLVAGPSSFHPKGGPMAWSGGRSRVGRAVRPCQRRPIRAPGGSAGGAAPADDLALERSEGWRGRQARSHTAPGDRHALPAWRLADGSTHIAPRGAASWERLAAPRAWREAWSQAVIVSVWCPAVVGTVTSVPRLVWRTR